LGVVAILAAACGAPGPGPSASASSASLLAIATTAPSSPTPEPTLHGNCPTPASLVDGQPSLVSVDPEPSRAHLELRVTAIEAVWDPATRVVPEPRTIVADETGAILGGREFTIWPEYFYEGFANPQSMGVATATLTPNGQAPLTLPVRIVPGNQNFDQFAIMVPDLSGRARFDLQLQWVDQCFRFTAQAAQTVTVVPLAATQDCHLDQAHWIDDLGGVFDKGIMVESTTQALFATDVHARFSNQGAGGDPPNWAYAWKQHPGGLRASSGGRLAVSDTVPGRELKATYAELFRRDDALRLANDWTAPISAIWHEQPAPRSDGAFSVPIRVEPGRYVLLLRFDFSSACLTGSAASAFSVEVE
jgi:hypothetical protein